MFRLKRGKCHSANACSAPRTSAGISMARWVSRRDALNASRVAQWSHAVATPGKPQHLMLLAVATLTGTADLGTLMLVVPPGFDRRAVSSGSRLDAASQNFLLNNRACPKPPLTSFQMGVGSTPGLDLAMRATTGKRWKRVSTTAPDWRRLTFRTWTGRTDFSEADERPKHATA